MEYKEAVKWFGDHMLKVMTENGHKSPIPKEHLFNDLMGETTELHTEMVASKLSTKKVIKECVDVANYAMMIALESIGVNLENIYEPFDPNWRYG